MTTSVFDLPERLAAKSDPALIGTDEQHFARIEECLRRSIEEIVARLVQERQKQYRGGQEAMERDQQVHRLTAELRNLRRYGLDVCLGHLVPAEGSGPVYVGRMGLRDSTGTSLLIDWRSPAAEPFFGATHADPMGLLRRRRYRWTRGRISDYWDEVFTADGRRSRAALDDQSAFIASLGSSRSAKMRDVLGTIAADQDAIIRAESRGALVVDGGPGTGKTVVALHRTAYLLYRDPRLGHDRGGVLFVGPHQPYLNYVADVLPSLGEEGVRTCTLRDLVVEGETAGTEADPRVARLKAGRDMVAAIERAVRFYEDPPTTDTMVPTDWVDVRVSPGDWSEAFDSATGVPHNEAHGPILDELVSIVTDRLDEDIPVDRVAKSLRANKNLHQLLTAAWPMIDPTDLVGDLWTVPAYLRWCAPQLTPEQVQRLQRSDPAAWTESDLPLLDAARQRLGVRDAAGRERRRTAAQDAAQQQMSTVIKDLIATDDSELQVMSMLRGEDLRDALVDPDAHREPDRDRLAGPFAHIVVDEAQELTDAQWQMLLLRCPSRSFTIVGDRAQARHGFGESWSERLQRVGFERIDIATLSINYRTPAEVMEQAAQVIRAALPDANVPTSVRSTGIPVEHRPRAELRALIKAWRSLHDDGIACVISADGTAEDWFRPDSRLRWLTPELAKGLEFDLVVLVDPDSFGAGIEGAVDRYVAMTRATDRLVILTG